MALTALLVWPVLRALDARALWLRALAVLLVALPASVGIAAINQWAFADIESEVIARIGEKEGIKIRKDEAGNVLVDVPGDQELAEANAVLLDTNRWRQISDLALGRYFVLLAWAALYLAFANAEQARAAERREGEYRRAAKAAELRSLRYQVNPHFLFNTLNSLSARCVSEAPTADHTLAEEIELQRLYLDIEAVRFPERLRVRIDIPDDLAHARVPGMILQPLVENSVKYAVAARRDPVTIAIAARAAEGWLEIAVSDDGPGAVHPPAEGCGIGLANVRDRLAARFGAEAGLESGPAPGGWRTTIRLPLEVVA
ncbi:MAG TPA: histidine kinase, partial [Novosphingobium sp.]|nr:histidine kinase [Novosphingobium sp.]